MRMTMRTSDGKAYWSDNEGFGWSSSSTHSMAVLEKLAAYEDAEEQGRLVILPCKAGETVFYTTRKASYKAKVIALRIYESSIRVYCERNFMGVIGFEGIFGKTVFLSREEAEAALKGESKDV